MPRPPPLDFEQHLFESLRKESGVDVIATSIERAGMLRRRYFDLQHDFLTDPSRRKVICCPRRSGKTEVIEGALVLPCLELDHAKTLYLTTTLTQAKRNIWEPLQQLNLEYGLGAKFHHTEVYARFPRGGLLYLGGAQTERDIARYRGWKLHRCAIDEAASFDDELLMTLIRDVITPCLYDYGGTLILGGTPGPILSGYFYNASGNPSSYEVGSREGEKVVRTRPYRERDDPQWERVRFSWSFHGWSMAENAAMPQIWEEALDAHRMDGDSDADPTWRREALGEWVEDLTALVYKYDERKNGWDPLPDSDNEWGLPKGHRWRFLAGADPGYDDDFSFQVGAWSPTCRDGYHVDGFSEAGLDITAAAGKIKEWEKRFGGFDAIVADTFGLGKVYFEEMRRRHGIAIIPRPWREKRDVIELANAELLSQRAKIRRGSVLERQMKKLQWKNPKRKDEGEHPRQPNDACDAWAYQLLHSLHHYARPKLERGMSTWEKEQEWEKREYERIARKRMEADVRPGWRKPPEPTSHDRSTLHRMLKGIRRALAREAT